ncbi:hypothetical protein NDU88_006227 [Pleurodeles waltl]|uniref:Uncharacterized protein n=1 Tax=Pleurodeles waltl TaxID=8319 RepID=A0AAV7SP52_PLEWA|nr:hypothetical protein NDU88_006227 [Pleurodeles waltl]
MAHARARDWETLKNSFQQFNSYHAGSGHECGIHQLRRLQGSQSVPSDCWRLGDPEDRPPGQEEKNKKPGLKGASPLFPLSEALLLYLSGLLKYLIFV